MVAVARAVVCLSLWLSLGQVSASHIPQRMNRTIQNLLQHYKIPPKERFNGKPIFSKEPLSGQTEVKMLFMGGVLETYQKLIGRMLHELPSPASPPAPPAAGSTEGGGADGDVRAELNYVLTAIKKLWRENYQQDQKVLQGLHALKHIETNNTVVQSKALWELPWLFEEASSLTNSVKMQRRRRRRQARRVKFHPRA